MYTDTVVNCDLFQTLEDDIVYFDRLGRVTVCGDFNGRVSNKLDYIDQDVINESLDNAQYVPDVGLYFILPVPKFPIWHTYPLLA